MKLSSRSVVTPLMLSLILVLLCAGVNFLGSTGVKTSLTEGLIYVTLVVGLSIFVSNSGVVSFGHGAFAMIGAYASAWQTCCSGMREVFMPGLPEFLIKTDVHPVLALLAAGLLAAVVAAILGAAIMRLAGAAASIALLSVLFVVKATYENWDSVTAGQSAIVGLPLYVNLWVALAGAIASIVIAQAYACSRFGLRLRASREDEIAARAAGINVWRERLWSFVLSAAVSAVGGALYGHFLGSIAVNMYWLDFTFLVLAMLVVGGVRSLSGAVLGALIVVFLRSALRSAEEGINIAHAVIQIPQGIQEITLALLLLFILIFRPDGIMGDFEFRTFKNPKRSEDPK